MIIIMSLAHFLCTERDFAGYTVVVLSCVRLVWQVVTFLVTRHCFSVTFSYGLYTTHAPQEFSPAQVGKS